MRAKRFIYLALSGISIFGLSSCQNGEEPQCPIQEVNQTEMSPLVQVLVNVVDAHEKGATGDSYIIYDSSTGEYSVMSTEDYKLANAFANVITRAPQGNGWTLGGRGKGRTQAMKLALNLASKLEKERDFEIHVEYGDNGSFTVWYRYV